MIETGAKAVRVRLLEGPFKVRQDIHLRHLLAIEPDRLLAPFRSRAGLEPRAARYGGWESRDISGHSLGHYLSGLAYMFQATGDRRLQSRLSHILRELQACQEADGTGYVLPVDREAFDRLRSGVIDASPFSLNGVWVPFYTLHKLLAGLRDCWRVTGEEAALAVSRGLCDWLDGVLSPLDGDQIQRMLQCEHGGMNEVLADLSADSGEPRYLRMAEGYFHHADVLGPMLRGEDRLDGLHGNTQIPKVVGLAREFELTGNPAYRLAAASFWDAVVNRRSYATGGHGESEHFFPVHQFPDRLSPNTCETCNTYNMLKLSGHLFDWDPQAAYMDYVERGLINHLAANIGREPGEFGYFLGLGSVAVKVFSTPYDSWWCCVGTGLENPGRYGEHVYRLDRTSLYVNLYMGSLLECEGGRVEIVQETLFPDSDTVCFTFRCAEPWRRRIQFRHPSWCEMPEVRVNGVECEPGSEPSSYFSIERTWKTGDVVRIRFPMALRLEALPHSGNSIQAVLFGPILLAAVVPEEPGLEHPAGRRFSEHLDARGKTDAVPPVFIAETASDVLSGFVPCEGFAEFQCLGRMAPRDLKFLPLHRIYEEQYAVYFPLYSEREWQSREGELRIERERARAIEAATVDRVDPGHQQPEVEHRLRCEKSTTSDFQGRKCRETLEDGWFSYEMKVAEGPLDLVATYWGGEWVQRDFDILVDGQTIATQSLRTNKPGDFFDVSYPVPAALAAGRTRVTVRFQPRSGSAVGRLFGLRVMSSGTS